MPTPTYHERSAALFPDVVNGTDVWMVQRRGGLNFLPEAA